MGTRWRAGLVAPLLVLAAACSAERAAPSLTAPPPPSHTTASTTPTAPPPSAADLPSSTSTSAAPATTAERSTTTTAKPITAREWVAFDEALATEMLLRGDHAVSVAISMRGEILHRAAFGVRVPVMPPDPAPGGGPPPSPPPPPPPPPPTTAPARPPEPVEPTDRFRIASLSKIVTAIVTLQLVEDGRLALDERIGARLARHVGAEVVDPAIGSITVRQLLSHTSGFNEYEATFFGGLVGSCPEAAYRGLSRGLDAPPGTDYNYSNLNFCLLSQLIEVTTGRPYADVVRNRLLAPLGIEGMRLAGTFDVRKGEVEHLSIPTRNYMEVLGGAGGWVATAADVVRIVRSLDARTPGFHPLSRRMVELMRKPAPPPVVYTQVAQQWYGLGLIVYADGSFGHTGTIESTHAMVLHRPDCVTWSVLVSGEYPSDTSDLRAIVDQALQAAGITFS